MIDIATAAEAISIAATSMRLKKRSCGDAVLGAVPAPTARTGCSVSRRRHWRRRSR